MSTKYCTSCYKEVNQIVEQKTKDFIYNNEKVMANISLFYCQECRAELPPNEQENEQNEMAISIAHQSATE